MPIKTLLDAENALIGIIQKVKLSLPHPHQYGGINDPLAEVLGFTIKEQALNSEYGLYICNPPSGDKPIVAVDPYGSDEEKLNFTYFHEVTHHLIRLDDDIYGFLDGLATKDQDLNALKERFANLGAAEFLLPSNEVREFINKHSFSVKLIQGLDQIYPASKPAIAIQLARFATHKCFVLICAFDQNRLEKQEQAHLLESGALAISKVLYVQYSASSPSNKYSIARNIPISKKHMLWEIFEQRIDFSKGHALIPFRSQRDWKTDCEGMYYKGKVYAIFNLEKPNPPENIQPRLL